MEGKRRSDEALNREVSWGSRHELGWRIAYCVKHGSEAAGELRQVNNWSSGVNRQGRGAKSRESLPKFTGRWRWCLARRSTGSTGKAVSRSLEQTARLPSETSLFYPSPHPTERRWSEFRVGFRIRNSPVCHHSSHAEVTYPPHDLHVSFPGCKL